MSSISATIRLRPIRFAFLVRPNDKVSLLKIFQINTCLWAGSFNPIIPVFSTVPKWWDRHAHHFEKASQIINGYLDYFEPDFLVEAEAGLASTLEFDKDRILQLSSLLKPGGEKVGGFGLDVFDLYRDLYRKEFQFVRRSEQNIFDIRCRPKDKSFKLFCACSYGAFPTDDGMEYFGHGFSEIFNPKNISLSPETFSEIHTSNFTTSLKIGHSNIKINYFDHSDPVLFVMNANDPRDLIDYWNLRATKPDVLAIPLQWIEALSPFCKNLIKRNHRPLPGNPNGIMIRLTTMFARSIPTDDILNLYNAYLKVDQDGANVVQDWYPPIWRPSPSFSVRRTRPILTAKEKQFDTQINEEFPQIRFNSLHPDFAEEFGGADFRWANVLNLRDWTGEDRIATVFPCNYKSSTYPKFRSQLGKLLSTTEGLTFFSRFKDSSNIWRLDDGTTAIKTWLKTLNIESNLSDAGRTTQQIIYTLGGFWGVDKIAHKDIISLLNKISRQPISPSMQADEFKNRIDAFVKNDIWRHKNFETLVERGAVELGLELKCIKCGSWGWHPINRLSNEVDCRLCLKKFKFPLVSPGSKHNSKWAYRLVGPFVLPDFAKGGYVRGSVNMPSFGQLESA
ncbi:hypothetical protein RGU75_02145 [Glaciimonas sp. CA11.2]|uniref:hypothetical protein n=1 Tax=Glaciimonas sp. CA11.2 TaxID=3048601 RepID=UPI002AB363D5|nr:hypothetical protein [Glaciimonas sp. CA11.2]MDY7545035.1 hypothetical protein [Glaciimonas sp. CA11.2]